MEQNIIVASPPGDYVELAGTKDYSGKHYRKHILNLGELIHPVTREKLTLDDAFYAKLKQNFERGVCDTVAVPLANDENKHVEGPLANAGQVMGIGREGSKIYVDLDVRDPKVQDALKNKTILGASAFMHLDYTDTRTGQKVGPTLLHSCMTNRPYVTGLDDYEEIVSATADSAGDVIVLAQEAPQMDKDQLIAALKEHGIDVAELQAQAASASDQAGLTAALTAALAPAAPAGTDPDAVSLSDVVQAVASVAERNVALTATVDELKLARATDEVDGLIGTGHVMPKQREAMIELSLENRKMFDQLLPAEPIVKMSAQEGANDPDPAGKSDADIDAEVARLSAVMAEQSAVKGARK